MFLVITILLTGSSIDNLPWAHWAGDLTRINLTQQVKTVATHTAGADEFWIGHVLDGDLATH